MTQEWGMSWKGKLTGLELRVGMWNLPPLEHIPNLPMSPRAGWFRRLGTGHGKGECPGDCKIER